MALPWRLVPIVGLLFLILAVPAWGASPVMEPTPRIFPPGLPGLIWLTALIASKRNFKDTASQMSKLLASAMSVLKKAGPK